MATVPKGSLVLVSGANGFIAGHVTDQLLSYGYKVRGTVRTDAKGQALVNIFDKAYGKGSFTYVLVSDIADKVAFHAAVKGVRGIAHVASPVSFDGDPKMIDEAVAGVRNVLDSAATEPGIARFVLTSSSVAAYSPKPNIPRNVNRFTYNDEDVQRALDPEYNGENKGPVVYCASKTLAEKEIWKFVEEQKPTFTVNTVLPSFTLGRMINSESFGSTAGMVRDVWDGTEPATSFMRDVLTPQYHVHVKDIALLHVAGLALPWVQNERLFGFADRNDFNDFIDVMNKIEPGRKLPAKVEGLQADQATIDTASSLKALQELKGSGFRSFEEGVRESLLPPGHS